MSFHPYPFGNDYRGLDDGYGYGDADGQSYIGGDYYADYGHEARDSYSAGDDLLLGDVVADDRLYDHDGWTCPDLYACTDFIEHPTPVYDAWGDESWEEEQVRSGKENSLRPHFVVKKLTRRDLQYALADLMVRPYLRPHDRLISPPSSQLKLCPLTALPATTRAGRSLD